MDMKNDSAAAAREINREKNGQFGDSFEAVCRCGHTKGDHIAGGHECVAHEFKGGSPCECEKFRRSRK